MRNLEWFPGNQFKFALRDPWGALRQVADESWAITVSKNLSTPWSTLWFTFQIALVHRVRLNSVYMKLPVNIIEYETIYTKSCCTASSSSSPGTSPPSAPPPKLAMSSLNVVANMLEGYSQSCEKKDRERWTTYSLTWALSPAELSFRFLRETSVESTTRSQSGSNASSSWRPGILIGFCWARSR